MLHRELGLVLPAPLRANALGSAAILWLGPREWLIETDAEAGTTAQLLRARRNARAEGTALHAITDLSDALAGFNLSGLRAPEVLMSGCSLDLRPEVFSAGHTACTAIADVPAIIRSVIGAPESSRSRHFRCWVDRSFAAHFWDWLAESPSRW
jgi:sarcosine oxidase, subunit gamma